MSEQKLWRKFAGAIAVGAVAASSFSALSGVAVAETAPAGASIYKDNIFWWTPEGSGTNSYGSELLAAGQNHTSTSTSKIGDSELAVTCTITNLGVNAQGEIVSPGLITKVPGNDTNKGTAIDKAGWKGESFSLLYNSGTSPNLLANGLTFFNLDTTKPPEASGMYTRQVSMRVKEEAKQGIRGPWTQQVERFGGVVDANGNITKHPTSWPETVEFDWSCSATLDGVPVPLDGLVLANAESNGNQTPDLATSEWQSFTPQGEGADTATWHALDIWNACAPASDIYSVDGNNTLLNHPRTTGTALNGDTMPECANQANKSFSSSAFLSGATSVHVTMHEARGAAGSVGLGVFLSSDFGDAPQSYGVAGNYFAGMWDNVLERGNDYELRNLAGANDHGGVYKTGSKSTPDYYLGATRDTEQPKNIVLNKYAKGDDSHNDDGSGGDEDGFAPGPDADLTDDLSTSGGTTTYSTDVQCTANNGTGYVGGWIDWNMDGAFDTEGEQATAQCTGGTAKLTWSVPANKVIPWPGSPDFGNPADPWSYLRLRISSNPDDIKPNGIGKDEGEVEDYRVTWNTPVDLAKTSYTDPAGVDKIAGTTYGWEVTLTNTGNLDYTDAYPMEMWDDLEDAYNHMDEITLVSVEGGGSASIDPDTKQLTWKGPLPAGKSIKLKYQGVITKYDDGRLQNAASSAYDPDHAETVTDSLAKLEITKDSSATTVNADGTVDYTIKVTNNGKSNTPIRSGSLLDDLSDVLDDGEVIPSSITATIGTAKLEGSQIKWSLGGGAVLKKGETATITYTVKINKRDGNGKAINKVTLDNAYSDQENTSTTTTDVINPPLGDDRVTVGKKGEKQSTTIEDMFEKGTGDITDYALVDPETGETTDTVTIPGQGTYTIEDGKVVFTPEPGYEGTPTPVKVRATDSNGLTAEGEYQPHVLGESTATRTITYKYLDENGQEAATTVVQKTEFEQVPVLGDDGKPQFNDDGTPKFEWKVKDGQSDTLNQVDSPDLSDKGWTPNKSSIPAVQVKPGDNIVENVVYTPQPPVGTPDETYGGKDQPQTGTPKFEVTTSTTPDGTPNEIVKTELLDENGNPATEVTVPEGKYVLNDDGTITFTPNEGFVGDPTPVNVRGTDKNGKSAETTYTPHVKDNTATKTVKRTIHYTYVTEDGKKVIEPVVQEVTFTTEVTVDPKTGELGEPDWSKADPQTLEDVDSPDLTGKNWKTNRPNVPAVEVKATDDDIVEHVVYTTTWVKYVDEDGNTIYLEQTDLDENGNEPPAPNDPTKDGFKFTGWDREVDENGNVTYIAHWEPVPNPDPSGDPSPISSTIKKTTLVNTGAVTGVGITLAVILLGAGFLLLRRKKQQ